MKITFALIIQILIVVNSFSQQCSDFHFPIENRIEQSDLTIEGKIVSKESYEDERLKSIFTKYKVEVYKVFKGNTANYIEFHITGGTIGSSCLSVSHQEKYGVGQEGIFFFNSRNNKLVTLGSTITFFPENLGIQAADFSETYLNIEEEIYSRIANTT